MVKNRAKVKHRAFLKWAGGKYGLSDVITKILPKAERLVEPFVGAGSIFLNSNYSSYLLNDINQDLINLYKIIQVDVQRYIDDARELFIPANNTPEQYYNFRAQFNASRDSYQRSLLFLYLNRYGYNGLCRYNKLGGFNVPFGRYKQPYFPQAELEYFAEKAQQATFVCLGYRDVFAQAQQGDVFYCDPPYVPLSKTASFTGYAGNGFGLDEQADLANAAEEISQQNKINVLISNHDTTWTRKIYQHAKHLKSVEVARTISQNGKSRNKVAELLVLYK